MIAIVHVLAGTLTLRGTALERRLQIVQAYSLRNLTIMNHPIIERPFGLFEAQRLP